MSMVDESGVLARGPWEPGEIQVRWHSEPYVPSAETTQAADRALQKLRGRGSPSHDGLAARMRDYERPGRPAAARLQPVRWSLRLLPGAAGAEPVSAVRRARRRGQLAGRAPRGVAGDLGTALGARRGGSVEVDENPADTLARELGEEWSVSPSDSRRGADPVAGGITMLLGQAWLADGAQVTPDAEHDEFEWWPADPGRWPAHADQPLRLTAALLAAL